MSRGISKITLYENKGLSITYTNTDTVSMITTTGQTLVFDYCYSPEYETDIKRGANNTDVYEREVKLSLLETEQYDNLASILDSYYGWIAIVESEGDSLLIPDPLFGRESNEDWQAGVNYGIILEHDVDSTNMDLAYNEGTVAYLRINADDFLLINSTDILKING